MVKTIDKHGWSLTVVVSGIMQTRAELLERGFKAADLDRQKAELGQDIDLGLVPPKDSPLYLTEEERRLADPDSDAFVMLFDGQHRFAYSASCCFDAAHTASDR
jgi:hypothetical protein